MYCHYCRKEKDKMKTACMCVDCGNRRKANPTGDARSESIFVNNSPCVVFNCEHKELCKVEQLSCAAYGRYIKSEKMEEAKRNPSRRYFDNQKIKCKD